MINAPTLPSFPEKLLLPEVLWKTGNFLHQMLRHRETKNIDRTVKCKKNFKTKRPLKHQSVLLLYEKVSALWVKKQSKENHDKRPHPPIFSRKIIATRNFLKHWKVPPSKVSALWDKENSKKSGYAILLKRFFRTRCFLKQRWDYLRNIFVLLDEKFRRKRDASRIEKKLTEPEVFWNNERFLCRTFQYCETKIFRHNRESLFFWWKLSELKFFWSREGFVDEFIITVRQKTFDKVVIAPAIEKKNRNQKFRKHVRVSLRNVSPLWDKNFPNKSWYSL